MGKNLINLHDDGKPKPTKLMPGELALWAHPSCLPPAKLLASCDVLRGKSGGPGGQNRNKVSTHITLTHLPTGHTAQAGERRSQIENRDVALGRLRVELAVKHRTPVPKGRGLAVLDLPAGSPLWRSRVRHGKIACNPSHPDFPGILAEAMDVLADVLWDPKRAAMMLDVTASQLVRFLGMCPEAMLEMNTHRKAKGQHAIKP